MNAQAREYWLQATIRVGTGLLVAALVAGCAGPPSLQDRPETHALQPSSAAPPRSAAARKLGCTPRPTRSTAGPSLSARSRDVAQAYPELAYRVSLDQDGDLQWEDGSGKVFHSDPDTSWFDRTVVEIGSWLPMDWLL
jgi:hypothetical protein